MRRSVVYFAVFAAFANVVTRAGDYPINSPATNLQPKQLELVLSTLLKKAKKGEKDLVIQDPPGMEIDARQWILLRSRDGLHQEIHCIKSIRREPVGQDFAVHLKLTDGLKHTYMVGAQLIQGTVARERGIVARLAKDRDDGDQKLVLDSTAKVDLLEQLILQSVDGLTREAHCVRWVEGREVRLFGKLFNDYGEGSLLIQGGTIDGEIEREDLPCRCENKKNWGR